MFSQLTPATKNIIIINVIFFVGTFLLQNLNIDLESLLAGYFPLSPNFRSWQIITHMFMHGSILHIAFNMMTLWSFVSIRTGFGTEKVSDFVLCLRFRRICIVQHLELL